MTAALPTARRRFLALGLIAIALLATACGGSEQPQGNQGGLADDAGPQRAVVIAPAAAEMLESLDLLDRVVGIGQYGPWPGAIAELPVAGGYNEPNVETLLTLRADVVLSVKSEAADRAHQRLRELDIQVLELDTSTHEGIFAAFAAVGEAFGRHQQAADLAAELRREIEELSLLAKTAEPRRVLFVVGTDPIYVAGPGSHIDQMILDAGGSNIAHDALSPYQQVSIEAMLERLPEVIIDTSDNRTEAVRGQQLGAWDRWDFLPAVQNQRVYHIDPSQLVIPGMRLPQMTRLMGQLIHPEVYGAPEPEQFETWTPPPARQTSNANPGAHAP